MNPRGYQPSKKSHGGLVCGQSAKKIDFRHFPILPWCLLFILNNCTMGTKKQIKKIDLPGRLIHPPGFRCCTDKCISQVCVSNPTASNESNQSNQTKKVQPWKTKIQKTKNWETRRRSMLKIHLHANAITIHCWNLPASTETTSKRRSSIINLQTAST